MVVIYLQSAAGIQEGTVKSLPERLALTLIDEGVVAEYKTLKEIDAEVKPRKTTKKK